MGDAEAIGQPLGRDPQMHLALPPHHHFVGLGIVHDGERGIFLEQLGQGLAELDVVLALLGGDRDGEHRRIGGDLGELRMRLLAGGQRVAGGGMVELAESHRLTRLRGPALLA